MSDKNTDRICNLLIVIIVGIGFMIGQLFVIAMKL